MAPVPNSPRGLCGRKAAVNLKEPIIEPAETLNQECLAMVYTLLKLRFVLTVISLQNKLQRELITLLIKNGQLYFVILALAEIIDSTMNDACMATIYTPLCSTSALFCDPCIARDNHSIMNDARGHGICSLHSIFALFCDPCCRSQKHVVSVCPNKQRCFERCVCLDLLAAPETAGACCEERSWRSAEASRQSHLAQLCCLRVQDGHQCRRKVRQSLRVTRAHLRSKKLLAFLVFRCLLPQNISVILFDYPGACERVCGLSGQSQM